jgi:choline monooxygenase
VDFSDYTPTEDTARATTLPARWYTDPEVLEAERRSIFHRSWPYVGSAEWLKAPGDHLATEIQGERLVVTRDKEGRLRALSNVCRHRAGPLAEGKACSPSLQCKYHGWTYDLDGRLRAAPEFDGAKDWDKSQVKLPEFRLEAWGPLLFVSLDAEVPPLADYLGDIVKETNRFGADLSDYRFVYRRDYVIDCNWKTYVDNYQEGYHIPLAHPALFREVDYNRYVVENGAAFSRHRTPVRASQGAAPRQYAEAAGKEALYYWLFPNLMINVYPDNLSTNLVVPLGPEKTLTVFEWFVPKDSKVGTGLPPPAYHPLSRPLAEPEKALPEDLAATIAFSHQVQLEDIYLCEAVQRGLHSRTYDKGRLSPKRENGVHHFHKLLHAALSRVN